jgi:hypothetical protein
MIHKNHFLPKLFDPFDSLGKKVRRELDNTWAFTFRNHILPKLPVEELGKKYHPELGRPSKNLHSGLGMLLLQQMEDTTDRETIERLMFDQRWQYALDITRTTDAELYMCERTLVELRKKAIELGVAEKLFEVASDGMIAAGGVDVGHQRMDSVHVKSNMKRLGRLRLVGRTIQSFLKNLKRQQEGRYEEVSEELRKKYDGGKKGEDIFSRVKPSETGEKMEGACQDLSGLVEQFSGDEEVGKMYSYQTAKRVLLEQCKLVEEEEGEKRVEVKKAKEVGGDSVQNPSDVDSGYSGHKGQGYSVQAMETYTVEEGEGEKQRLITYVEVTSAAVTDHHAVVPALEAVEERGVKPKVLLGDTLYGSDENVQQAEQMGVELVAPVANTEKGERIPLSSFVVDEKGVVTGCPMGQLPVKVKVKGKRVTAWFSRGVCEGCAEKERCPVLWTHQEKCRLSYELLEMRCSNRRRVEEGEGFKEKYRWRSGIEGCFSEWDRRTGVKHLRVRGLKAVRFAVMMKALGLNVLRFMAWKVRCEAKQAFLSPFLGGGRWLGAFFDWIGSILVPTRINWPHPCSHGPETFNLKTDFLHLHQS